MIPAMLLFLLASALLGYRVISRVPPLLHTPLMSGMNALSGITLLGSLTVYASAAGSARGLAAAAILLAMVNVAGGFWVTERMLRMFRNKTKDNGVEA